MADQIHGDTQAGPTKEQLIAAIVQKELKSKAVITPYFTDVSEYAVEGMESISFPKLSSFVAQLRAEGAKGDSSVISALADKLELDKNAYIAWIVDSKTKVQSKIKWELELAKRAASAHGRLVTKTILDEVRASYQPIVTGNISRDNILDLREAMRLAYGDLSQSVLMIAPDQETIALKIDEFTRAEVYGQAVVQSGILGKLYGTPVVVVEDLNPGEYFMVEKTALCYGFQSMPSMSTQGANEYGTTATRTAMDQLFGVKALQVEVGSAPAGKSALLFGK